MNTENTINQDLAKSISELYNIENIYSEDLYALFRV
jgi:hypothetical protein